MSMEVVDVNNVENVQSDETKLPLELVPVVAIEGMAMALGYGCRKHGEYGWRNKRLRYSAMYAKIMRHMTDWYKGSDADHESGLHPLDHAGADLAILIEMVQFNKGTDDRWKP